MTMLPSSPASPTGSLAWPALPTVRRPLITLDGSRFFSSERVDHCLTTTSRGITSYHHDILQAAIVHPDKRQVLAPEFVRNSDADGATYRKQVELNAGYRMLPRRLSPHGAIIVADSLYSKQPVEQLCAARFSFLLVDHRSLYHVAGLRGANLLTVSERPPRRTPRASGSIYR